MDSDHEQEQLDTVARICESPFLRGLKYGGAILRFLFDHRDRAFKENEIAGSVLKARTAEEMATGNARQALANLRKALENYAEAGLNDDLWRVMLRPQDGKEGYQLRITNLRSSSGAVQAFWRAHLKPCRPVIVVRNEPLFYRDGTASAAVRVLDEALAAGDAGKKRAEDALSSVLGESLDGEVYESRLYALSGEVNARDRIADWFLIETGQRIFTLISQQMVNADELADSSPILLGNARSNHILKDVMDWHPKKAFPFRVDEKRIRTIQIIEPNDSEINTLTDKFDPEEDQDNFLLIDDPRPDGVVFATVTRMPNQYTGENAVTVLSASYTKALEQVAWLLTDEASLRGVFRKLGWSLEEDIPAHFQWLFSVRLGKFSADSRGMKPALEAFRPSPERGLNSISSAPKERTRRVQE